MDSAWTQDLVNWISLNPALTGVLVFAVACVESLVLIGILIPGMVFLFAVGAMIGLGAIEFLPIWICGSAGALLGDLASYAVGRRYREHLVEIWPFSRYPALLQRGIRFIHQHGNKSVLAGRFIGPLRPIIPATAGMLGMQPARFAAADLVACILWSPAYLLPGMLFGASLEVATEYAGRLSLVLIIAVVMLYLTWWMIWAAYEFLIRRSAQWLRKAINWTRRHRLLGRLTGPVLDPSQPELLSVSMLGLMLVLLIWGLVMLLFLSPFSAQPQAIDQAVFEQALALRNHLADPYMVAIMQISRWWVLLPAPAAVLLWLLGAREFNAAMHWLVAIAGGVILQLVLGWTLRATPQLQSPGAEQVYIPSDALTLCAVVLGFFSVMLARELGRRRRKWPYFATALLLSMLLLARLYLGLDWFSGSMVGILLGFAWTAIVGIAYRQRAKQPFSGVVVSIIFVSTLTLSFAWQIKQRLAEDLETLRPPLSLSGKPHAGWWSQGWRDAPQERSRNSSVLVREFNIQVALPLETIRRTLLAKGWEPVPPANWTWLMKTLNPDPDVNSLAVLSKDFQGRQEVLKLRNPEGNTLSQLTFRVWDSGIRLAPGDQPLYLVQWSEEVLQQRLKFFSHWRAIPLSAERLQELAGTFAGFGLKQARDGLWLVGAPSTESGAAGVSTGQDAPAGPPSPATPGAPGS